MSSITPTVGRKVWFWASHCNEFAFYDPSQPLDATICYVNSDGTVCLAIQDHDGDQVGGVRAALRDYDNTNPPQHGYDEKAEEAGYATWMPYQMGQAKRA